MNPVQGSSRILESVWTDQDGAPLNPTVELFIQDPSGDITSPVVTNPSVGTFQYELLLDEAGIYDYEWVGTTVDGSEVCRGQICVDASVFAGVT